MFFDTLEIVLNEVSSKIHVEKNCFLELDTAYSSKFSLNKSEGGSYFIKPTLNDTDFSEIENTVAMLYCYSDSLLKNKVGRIMVVTFPIPQAEIFWNSHKSGDTIVWSEDLFLSSKFYGLSTMSTFSYVRFQIKEFSISNLQNNSLKINWSGSFKNEQRVNIKRLLETDLTEYVILHNIIVLSPDGQRMNCNDHFIFKIEDN